MQRIMCALQGKVARGHVVIGIRPGHAGTNQGAFQVQACQGQHAPPPQPPLHRSPQQLPCICRFERQEEEVAELRKLTKDDVIAFFRVSRHGDRLCWRGASCPWRTRNLSLATALAIDLTATAMHHAIIL